jgi:hypothetical protein
VMAHPLFDPIAALQSLGYTEREASFLYLVAIHSGYFVRRQFDYFTNRNKGALVTRFLKKARLAGHIEYFDYRQGWHVYHLFSRAIYRLLGDAESQNRRRKGDAQVRVHLMALDYVLENEGDHFLESDADRMRFFAENRKIEPRLFIGGDGNLLPLLASFPFSIADRTRPAQSLARVVFIDEGLLTIERFLRFLMTAAPLLRALDTFEVVYVSTSDVNFRAAKDAFWNRFSVNVPSNLRLFDDGLRSVGRLPGAVSQARFTTLLLGYSYPKLRRSETGGSTEGSHAER